MKLTKFSILVNKTTSLFTSILEIAKFPGGVRKFWKFRRGARGGGGGNFGPILENPEGIGVIRQIPSVGGMDIFWNHTIQKICNDMCLYILIQSFI